MNGEERTWLAAASSWTVVVDTPTGEIVAAGPWSDLTEARDWARMINRGDLARVRFTVPVVPTRDLEAMLIYEQRQRDSGTFIHKREVDWGYDTARCLAPAPRRITDDWDQVTCPACLALADPPH